MKIPAKYIPEAYIISRVKTYQTDATGNSGRKRVEDVNGWAQPLRQSLIATARFVKFSNLILKHGDDGAGGVTALQLRAKRMGEEVLLGLLLVGFQRSLEDSWEARGT